MSSASYFWFVWKRIFFWIIDGYNWILGRLNKSGTINKNIYRCGKKERKEKRWMKNARDRRLKNSLLRNSGGFWIWSNYSHFEGSNYMLWRIWVSSAAAPPLMVSPNRASRFLWVLFYCHVCIFNLLFLGPFFPLGLYCSITCCCFPFSLTAVLLIETNCEFSISRSRSRCKLLCTEADPCLEFKISCSWQGGRAVG